MSMHLPPQHRIQPATAHSRANPGSPLLAHAPPTLNGSAPASTGTICSTGSAPPMDSIMRPTAPAALSRTPGSSSSLNSGCSACSSAATWGEACWGQVWEMMPHAKAAFWRLMASCGGRG